MSGEGLAQACLQHSGLCQAGLGDIAEAEVTAAALATTAGVQPASLSKASPPLATATGSLSSVDKTEDLRGRAGATTTALTTAEVPQVSPSTPSSLLPDDETILDSVGEWSTVAETSRYQELISEQLVVLRSLRSPWPLTESDLERHRQLQEYAARHKEKLLRREARAALRRQRQEEQPPDGRPELSADNKRAG